MNAVDTNVLLYSVDPREPRKLLLAQALLRHVIGTAEPTVLLWQVLCESTQQVRRWRDMKTLTPAEFAKHRSTFRLSAPLVMPTPEVFDIAQELAAKYSLSHWDSLLLGACRAAGVTRLYTEDMGAPRRIDDIELINPFV